MNQATLFDAPVTGRRAAEGLAPRLFKIDRIYHEPAVVNYDRGLDVLARFPQAQRVEVPSHWNIPGLHGNEGNVADWNRIKQRTLVLGVKKGMDFKPNGRSCDFIPPSPSNGCTMSCAYCYVPRQKGFANPVTVFVNIEQICRSIVRHCDRLGPKVPGHPSYLAQTHPSWWVYDIGCNSDCSADALLSDNVRDLVALFRDRVPHGMATFATKLVNWQLLDYDPQGRTRVRLSLMPTEKSRLLDVRTSPVPERIAAINALVEAGYEVHLNFSPVVVYDGWQAGWRELLRQIDDGIGEAAKAQLACEIIFLTHNERLHQINLGWHTKAEELLWTPDVQQVKTSSYGGRNLRYRTGLKGGYVRELLEMIEQEMPYCRVRYAF